MALYSRVNARRSLIDTVLFRALSQVATVLSYVVLVRGMTREDFGVFNLLYAFIPVVSTVASLGLEQVLGRYQPEYLRAGNAVAGHWLVRVVSSARFGTNVIVLTVVLLTWNHVAPLFKLGAFRPAFLLFCPLVLLYFQARIMQFALASHMLHRFAVGSTVALALVKLATYASLALFESLTLEHAILADTLAYAIAFGMMRVVYQRKCLPEAPETPFKPAPTERRRMLRYGLFNNFNDAGVLLLYSTLDNFFIAAFIDTVSVGIYAFYTRIIHMAGNLLPGRLFDSVVQPLFFSTKQDEADRKLPQYFSFLLNINLLIQIPVLAFWTVYHAEFVEVIFGTKYVEHSWLLPTIALFSTLNILAEPTGLMAQYEEKVQVILLSKVFVLYNILAMYLMVPWAGIYGAALASGTAQLFKNLFIWWHVRRRARWSNFLPHAGSALVVWGLAIAVCYALKAIDLVPLADLVIGGLVFVAAALVYVRTPALSEADRAILGSVMAGKETRLLVRLGFLKPTNVGAKAE